MLDVASGVAQDPPVRQPERRPVREVEARQVQATPQSGSYEVRTGDTLWDLASRFLSDPHRWRDIFDLNTGVVEDPHWIFPGEHLSLPGQVTGVVVSSQPRQPAAARQPMGVDQEAGRGMSRFGGESIFDTSPASGSVLGGIEYDDFEPSPLVSASDYFRAPFLGDPKTFGPTGLTARKIQENPLRLQLPPSVRLNHRVVVALNGLQVEEGDRLQAFRWDFRLKSGETVATSKALLEVTETMGDSVRAVVTDIFGDYEVGDPVIVAEPMDVDRLRSHELVESGVLAELIGFGFELRMTVLGPSDFVFLSAGTDDGVALGDEFAIFSPNEPEPSSARWEDRLIVVRVVRAGATTSTARVVETLDTGTAAGAPARLVRRGVRTD